MQPLKIFQDLPRIFKEETGVNLLHLSSEGSDSNFGFRWNGEKYQIQLREATSFVHIYITNGFVSEYATVHFLEYTSKIFEMLNEILPEHETDLLDW